MNYRYLVKFLNDDGKVIEEIKYKTKKEIQDKLKVDTHIVNMLIKINNSDFKLKSNHKLYEDIYNKIKIIYIKPNITI